MKSNLLTLIFLVTGLCGSQTLLAENVTLTDSDLFNASSFDTAGNWSNGAAPSAGNDYFIDGAFRMRTPANGSSFLFGGDSLTLANNGADGDVLGFAYKGTGNTGVLTVNNLILDDGGLINHINGAGDLFQLDGNLNVVGDGRIFAKQGAIDVLSVISGSGSITNPGADGAGRTLRFLSAANSFNGDVINEGNFELASGARLDFVAGAGGTSNSVSGAGATLLDGTFFFDLSGAAIGDSWNLVTGTNVTYGANFSVDGFTEDAGVWSNGTFSFDTSTGVLSTTAIPEPGSFAVLGLGVLACTFRRRK